MRSRVSADQLARAFEARFPGAVSDVSAHGSGHIHDSFELSWHGKGMSKRLLVQRFNTAVFGDPQAVMQNIARVTDHLRTKLPERRVLRLQPTPDGAHFWQVPGAKGSLETYRAFEFIADTQAFELAQRPEHPSQAGSAFAEFVRLLEDLPGPPLIETIPGFHDTPARLRALSDAVARDPVGRRGRLQAELEFVEAHAELAATCAHGDLPLRVTHNDAKLSNLLFDARTGDALCVVDLDTVMPGFVAYDFGDLVRTTACSIAEDAADLSGLSVREDYVEALARGFLAQLGPVADPERESLALGPQLICFELGVRFLTDYVLGDTYFAISRPEQNLERARVQLALVERLAAEQGTLRRIIFARPS
ncbi:MAG TPA: aminoglycoside phosphotransferase family protein [Polyangiales bacterium]|nr:aminoglycoside phosphotransferase family protein [Polyangiales bacterium]